MILFSDLELKLFYVSQSVTNMINRFENDLTNESTFTKKMIVEEIKSFTTFQYLFFLKEALKQECSKSNLELMFKIGYHLESKEIVSLGLFKMNFDFREYGINLSDLEILNPFQKISLFMRFQKSSFAYKCDSYINQIRGSLERILLNKNNKNKVLASFYHNRQDFVFSIREKEFTINNPNLTDIEVFDELERWNYFIEDEWHGVHQERHYLYYSYESRVEELLNDEIQSIKKMNFFYANSVEYKIYEPLIFDNLSDWKKSVTKELLSSQADFDNKKSFYLECLNTLKKKIHNDRITKLEINYELSEEHYHLSSPFFQNTYLLSDLKNWIETQLPKDQAAKKEVQVLPLINFTKDFKTISEIFKIIFKKHNAFDNEQNNAIRNFILRNCDCKNQPLEKDLMIEKIIWQSGDLKEDFIKLFLYLIYRKIIPTDKTDIFKRISSEFTGKNNSLGFSTLKRKFLGRTEIYRKTDEIVFSRKNLDIRREIENVLKGIF